MFGDNRKFIRFEIPLTVAFGDTQVRNDQREGLTRNFSREGLCLISQDFSFDPQSVVELTLAVPEKDSSLTISGEVVWKKQIGDKWQAGVRFKEIDRAGKVDVLECAYNSWLDKLRGRKR